MSVVAVVLGMKGQALGLDMGGIIIITIIVVVVHQDQIGRNIIIGITREGHPIQSGILNMNTTLNHQETGCIIMTLEMTKITLTMIPIPSLIESLLPIGK